MAPPSSKAIQADLLAAGTQTVEALATATVVPAQLFHDTANAGTVAVGKNANLVLLDGNPLTDIHAVIGGVRWVMKGGKVVIDRR